MVDQNTVKQVTQVLRENYLSIGATNESALYGLAEDMSNNRIDVEDLECQHEELLIAIGQLISQIINWKTL